MKVGIITFHNAQNFGAFLQCFSLYKTLIGMYDNVEVIDYRQVKIEDTYKLFNDKLFNALSFAGKFQYLLSFLKTYSMKRKRKDIYSRMRKDFLRLSSPVYSAHDILNIDYDVIVIGSDQLWNTSYTKGADNVYWGLFDKKKVKLLGYAISGNVKSIKDLDNNTLKISIGNFDALTVREKSLAEIIYDRVGKNIPISLDPTLLHDGSFWKNFLTDCPIKRKKTYILCYGVRPFKDDPRILYKKACQLNQHNEYEIFDLNDKMAYFQYNPFQFLSLIYNADIIITSSFHGLVFSILFEKKFYAIKYNDGDDGRASDLVRQLNLQSHIFSFDEVLPHNMDWDFSDSKRIIKKLREQSQQFLRI